MDASLGAQEAGAAMRTGIWLVGARGSVATTAVVGAAAVGTGAAPPTGCVSEHDDFREVALPGLGELVFGGHDVARTPLPKRAEQLMEAGVIPHGLADLVREDLVRADAEIRPGVTAEAEDQAAAVATVVADLEEFKRRGNLERVVVVNVSSTEPPPTAHPAHSTVRALRRALASGEPVLPVSSVYAMAAFLAGCPYVDFTPSCGARLPALVELAHERGVPCAGSDGKTGETLVKSVLAPMFARRALRVRSWSGTNLLGGGDGAALADPARAAGKVDSKARVLAEVLGEPVEGGVHIHHVPDLGEWKTAWDHITFEGFLGTRMTMQFTWQGCDSSLAAPLVLDLARLMALAHSRGVHGPVPELAFFFKDPVAGGEHALEQQYAQLVRWANGPRVTQ
ncbi:inositol-3-phosphate synthase [Wenjunlia tyrosinilytica]|uniref:Myo-inositol-1-phosphate synthase n=1 Tax=Wenjunlia tyrosinilytica TaxID=1544741 RepID=A0A918DY63_9ACTN|nr:inositol-3-phosphate synthase [Wenjunlia tyrosinilytica]GGO87622.1 myo-inositol-1-phosphate synthase [Wenjunlia tyrosinilytica]